MALSISIKDSGNTTVTKFAAAADTYTITITKTLIGIFTSVIVSEEDWCTVVSSQQASSSTWQVVVSIADETTGNARMLSLNVETEDESDFFGIQQTSGTAITAITGSILGVTPTTDIANTGGTFKVYVQAAGTGADESETTAEILSGSFCTLTGTNHSATYDGETCTEFTFTFTANSTYSTRAASLRFTVYNTYGESYTLTTSKTQAAAVPVQYGTISFSDISVAASDTGASADLILSNVYVSSLSAIVPDWVTKSIDTTGSVPVLNLSFSANSNFVPRTGSIVVSGTDTGSHSVSTTRTITQAAATRHAGKIYPESKAVSADSGSVTIMVTTENMASVSATSSTTWLSYTLTLLSTETNFGITIKRYSLAITYDENTVSEERKGEIFLSGTDLDGITVDAVKMTLIQAAAKVVCDKIYVIDYNAGDPNNEFTCDLLYEGDLNFDENHPIESVVHFETEDIQKVYWIDGKNVLRFMNIAASQEERTSWDDTSFDSNRIAGFGVKVSISKDNAGNTRANGVVQYILTYYNKHGQETGYIWMSDLVYLSPLDHGGSADGYNMNKVTLKITNLDTSFTNFRIYSVFRSTQDGQTTAYLVSDQKTSENEVYVTDDGAHLVAQEPTRILYLGSKSVKADAITHKDNTLFLGNLQSVGREDYTELEETIRNSMFVLDDPSKGFQDGVDWESNCIQFFYSGFATDQKYISDIPDVSESGNYSYSNQLKYTSSEILSFKGGEKYRFALKFQMRDGTETDAFWIGDKVNVNYPKRSGEDIKRVVARCEIPEEVIEVIRKSGKYKTVRLCIAEASYADRSVKAQGVVNPTMFNTWERYMGRTYSYPSWLTRVRGAEYANQHFSVVENSEKASGEIQCNYWKDGEDYEPFFQYKNYDSNKSYFRTLSGSADFDRLDVAFRIRYKDPSKNMKIGAGLMGGAIFMPVLGAVAVPVGHAMFVLASIKAEFEVTAYIIKVKFSDPTPTAESIASVEAQNFEVYDKDVGSKPKHNKRSVFEAFWTPYGSNSIDDSKKNWYYYLHPSSGSGDGEDVTYDWRAEITTVKVSGKTYLDHGRARSLVEERMKEKFLELGLGQYFPKTDNFHEWCKKAIDASNHTFYVNSRTYGEAGLSTFTEPYYALNAKTTDAGTPSTKRWYQSSDISTTGQQNDSDPAYYKKHLMYVDENVLTLDSPELEQGLVQFDQAEYNFRIVGVAKMTSVISDYTADISHSTVPGADLDREIFSGSTQGNKSTMGIISWPLWKEYGLRLTKEAQKNDVPDEDRSFGDFELNEQIIRYWLYMWQHPGSVSGYTNNIEYDQLDTEISDKDDVKNTVDSQPYSVLKTKTWANLRYAYETMYLSKPDIYYYKAGTDNGVVHGKHVESIRTALEYNTNTLRIKVAGENKDYASNVQLNLGVPGELKYPICYSDSRPMNVSEVVVSDGAFLYSSSPVLLEYATKNHAIISLNTDSNYEVVSGGKKSYFYRQLILPKFLDTEEISFGDLRGEGTYTDEFNQQHTVPVTGALLPWAGTTAGYNYITISRNDADIAIPVYGGWGIMMSNPDYSVQYSVSGSGDKFERYVQVLQNCREAFNEGPVYISIDCGSSDANGQLTSGGRYVVNIYDICIEKNDTTGIWTLSIRDPKNIGNAVVSSGYTHDDTVAVNTYIATYDSSNGIVYSYSGAGELDVLTNVISPYSYSYKDYAVEQRTLDNRFNNGEQITSGDQYVFIGEIYESYSDPQHDSRYGGITLSKVQNNRFITAGPACPINTDGNIMWVYADQGDTYFQRWDGLRIKPYSKDSANNVLDIASVMVESHINLDGRTDLQRGINEMASIDITTFGQINRVYSQQNNFVVRRDLDEDYNTDTFKSSVTWTLPKTDMAEVDEWTHITLGATLKLDGDKGQCRALRRYGNRLLSFQDRGIAEIYFNSLTQLSTQDGVPVELGNSGKVSGKNYITNKYGCTNKWSIVEGKAGLYFIDNINKAFCAITTAANGNIGANELSTSKGFAVWFRTVNELSSWKPVEFNNFVSFYDRIHGDVYLVKKQQDVQDVDSDAPCLVYSEVLGEFTSFYDYGSVPMITNVDDRLVSCKSNKLWLQNEGKYCNFFNKQYPFWIQYRVTPEPYGDKIWTNLDYRADFYRVLNGTTEIANTHEYSFADELSSAYQPNETFDYLRFWNEYQTTEDDESKFTFDPEKKFRIWRYQIPRAKKGLVNNKFGLDRIRNPWMNIMLKKKYSGINDPTNQDLMQLHDVSVIYFE